MEKEQQNRIAWIDVAKGIGIVFVVLGHLCRYKIVLNYIYSFHMPFFFFLSGMILDEKKYPSFFPFLKKRTLSLVVPYFFLSAISYVLSMAVNYRGIQEAVFFEPLLGIIRTSDYDNRLMNGALWFLPCLFVTEIMFFALVRTLGKRWAALFIVLAGVIGYINAYYIPTRIPWGIDIGLAALPFLGAGYYAYQARDYLKSILDNAFLSSLVLFVSFCLGAVMGILNGQVLMVIKYYGNFFAFYSAAFLGIIFWAIISRKISRSWILEYLGKNSLLLFGMHVPLVVFITEGFGFTFYNTFTSSVYSVIVTVIVIAALIPLITLVNQKLPWVLGKSGHA